ncbi:MAG TPA: SDR family oxidoreductase, partial [Acidimicrobiales bacterium]
AAYGAAKAGVVDLTRSLAVEWAPKVRVNCVSADLIATEQPDDDAITGAEVPLGRMGTATDIADAVCYLASSLSAYVTGANLVIHGGGRRPAYLGAIAGT